MRHVRPLRWDLLAKVPRAELRMAALLRGHVAAGAGWASSSTAAARALGGVAPRLELRAAYAFARGELPARLAAMPWAALRVRRGDGRGLVLVVDALLAARLVARLFGVPEPWTAPRALTRLERGALAGVVASLLESHGAPGLLVDGVCDDAGTVAAWLADPWVVGADLGVEAAGAHGTLRVWAPESLLSSLPPPSAVGVDALARLASMPWRGDVLAAVVTLSPEEVAGVGPGDVVVLPGAARGQGLLVAGRGAFPVRYDADRLTVAEAWRPGAHMPELPADNVALPVAVTCRLAQIELSVRELAELAPGAVVELRRPLGSPVELCAGDRVVARGELVDVDGELGVRVTQIVK